MLQKRQKIEFNFSLNVTRKLRAVENTQKDTLKNSSVKKTPKISTHSIDLQFFQD
jgi:hypothetical protein